MKDFFLGDNNNSVSLSFEFPLSDQELFISIVSSGASGLNSPRRSEVIDREL